MGSFALAKTHDAGGCGCMPGQCGCYGYLSVFSVLLYGFWVFWSVGIIVKIPVQVLYICVDMDQVSS